MGTNAGVVNGRPDYRLFDSKKVALATLLGGPLAGVILIATNFVRLRRSGKAVAAVGIGLLATAICAAIGLSWRTPGAATGLVALGLLFLFCTWQIAKEVQGEAVEEHIARGGLLGTGAAAFVVAIATMVGTFGLVWGLVYEAEHPGVVRVGMKDQVVYSELTTRGTAVALGKALKDKGYLTDQGATVVLERGIGGRTVSYSVPDGVWNEYGVMGNFEELTRKVAPSVGGLPIEVKLLDDRGEEEAKSTVGEVELAGGDGVIYEGQVMEEEAEGLGELLQAKGIFRGKGEIVVLTRHGGEGTTLAFVVAGEAWKDAKTVSEMEALVREAAPVLGGLPIEMHLVNAQMEIEKDEVIDQE